MSDADALIKELRAFAKELRPLKEIAREVRDLRNMVGEIRSKVLWDIDVMVEDQDDDDPEEAE